MENILILSDIHACYRYAVEAVKMHPECRTVLFLGDGCRHLDALRQAAPNAAFVAVRGNCDTFLDGVSETELTLELGGHRIFLCHGHTHSVHEEYDPDSGIYLLCPGSIGAPRDGRFTYGLLSMDKKNVLFSVGEM